MTIPAIVLGASGYVGGELLRLIAMHPDFTLAAALSGSHAGKPVAAVFPHLTNACAGENFLAPETWKDAVPGDGEVAFFSAAPHGAAAAAISAALDTAGDRGLVLRVVDSSADFRHKSPAEFKAIYGIAHSAPALLDAFDCNIPELAPTVDGAYIAHPGCFTTAALLATVPLVKAGLVGEHLYLTGITGSTGSGRNPQPGTHHPERHSNLYAYKPLSHRHAPEIAALLHKACGREARAHFVPHSAPFARGIHMTVQARLVKQASAKDIEDIYRSFYARSPFVRFIDGTPRLKDVVASNHCHIGAAVSGDSVCVMCVIDNLVKGAAGGAMQWMNRLFALPEETGLQAAAPAWV